MLKFFSSLTGFKKTVLVGAIFGIIVFGVLALKNGASVKPFSSKGNIAKKTTLSSTSELTADEAIKQIKKLVKTKGISKIVKESRSSGKAGTKITIYKVQTKEGKIFTVNASTKKVTEVKIKKKDEVDDFFQNPESDSEIDDKENGDDKVTGKNQLTKEKALKKAEEYAKTVHKNFNEMTLVKIAQMKNDYVFSWQKIDKNKAFLPVVVSILVNGKTGKAAWFNLSNEKVTISTKPSVTKQQSEATASTLLSGNEQIVETNLYVLKDWFGKQTLVWVVKYRGLDNNSDGSQTYKNKMIDAITGKDVTSRDLSF